MDNRKSALTALLLLVAFFFALNAVSDRLLRSVRLDLTEQRLYTLSPGTRNVLRSIEEPITLTLFYSEDLGAGQPQLRAYAKRVGELLEEFSLIAGDNLRLERVNPEPFSEGQERAQLAGVSGLALPGSGERFYLGLLGVNSTDGRQTIPFFDPREERFLEYQLARLVHTLNNPEPPTVAVISSLDLDGGPPPAPNARPSAPWQIMTELRAGFDVRVLGAGAEEIPSEADVLLVVHPKNLPEPTQRAIDAFVIGGGRAIVFVDPLAEADLPPGAGQNPLAAMQADRSSGLNTLLEAWGVRVEPGQVAADRSLALQGRGRDGRPVSYVQYIAPGPEQLNGDDPVTGSLAELRLAAAGAIVPVEGATTTVTPLLTTSDESMLIDAGRLTFFADPAELLATFIPRGEPLTLAARITGRARSAFGAPTDEAGPRAPDSAAGGEINVIVVADVDMLSDPMWVREVRVGGMSLGFQQLSDNGSFLLNAVDNMTGSGDLISVRARGTYARPFTRVERIRAEAEQRYLAEQQALEAKRREAEQRIAELQQARPDEGGMILTPEQRAEIERFREELAATNRELRDVNFRLRKDVERLGLRLKVLNIAAAPAVVLLAALGLGAARAARRRAHRRALAGATRS